jgi:ribosomal protein S18 acetylase RimI-like enzyme
MIRKARPEDLENIFAIYQKVALDRTKLQDLNYQAKIQKEGFLLGLDNKEIYGSLIKEAHSFLVAEENGEITGYIIADHREKYYDDEYKTWFDPEAKNLYYNDPCSMSIAAIAVSPGCSQRGIATALLKELENKLKSENFKYLYSIATLAPVTNSPSIIFHTKNGFKRIAMGKPRTLFNLDSYSGVLFYKALQ